MTNYIKKRHRQSGRQECRPSERYRAALDAEYQKALAEIEARIIDGELPRIDFKLHSVTRAGFAKEYPCYPTN